MPLDIHMFPQGAIALHKEVQNHPRLRAALGALPPDSPLEEQVGLIFAYCGMAVDGYYNEQELEKLFDIAIERLKKSGGIHLEH